MDVGMKSSQMCELTEAGEIVERQIRTERKRLREVFGGRPQVRILMEASTESEWIACCLEELGHEVIVADPNFAPMYAHRSRRIKTNRRDAHALADACRLGAWSRESIAFEREINKFQANGRRSAYSFPREFRDRMIRLCSGPLDTRYAEALREMVRERLAREERQRLEAKAPR